MLKNKRLLAIFAILFFEVLSVTTIFQLLPLYLEKLGFSPSLNGLVTTVYAACGILAMPFLGFLSDRWGRRRVLLFCQVGTFLSILGLLIAKTPFLIFTAIMLDGLTSGNFPIAEAYVSDVTEPEDRVTAFRKVSMISYLGLVLGPLLAGFLSVSDFRLPIIAGAGFSFLTILVTFFFLPKVEASASEEAKKQKFEWASYFNLAKSPKLAPYFIQFGLFCVAFFLYTSGITLFLEHRFTQGGSVFGGNEVAYIFAAIGIYSIIFQGFILDKIQKRWGDGLFIKLAFLSAIIGYFSLGVIQNSNFLYLVLIFTVFGNSIIPQTLTGLISKNVSGQQQGVVMGMLYAMRSGGQIVMPLLAGFLIEQRYLAAWAWIPCVVYFVALAISMKLKTFDAPVPPSN